MTADVLPVLAVGALGAIDRTHATAAEDAQEAPRPQTDADQGVGIRTVGRAIDDESLDRKGTVGAGGRQHRFDLVAQRDIDATRLGEESAARLNRLGVRELEEVFDPLPLHAVHVSSS